MILTLKKKKNFTKKKNTWKCRELSKACGGAGGGGGRERVESPLEEALQPGRQLSPGVAPPHPPWPTSAATQAGYFMGLNDVKCRVIKSWAFQVHRQNRNTCSRQASPDRSKQIRINSFDSRRSKLHSCLLAAGDSSSWAGLKSKRNQTDRVFFGASVVKP